MRELDGKNFLDLDANRLIGERERGRTLERPDARCTVWSAGHQVCAEAGRRALEGLARNGDFLSCGDRKHDVAQDLCAQGVEASDVVTACGTEGWCRISWWA